MNLMGNHKTINDIHPLVIFIANTYNKTNSKNILGRIYRIIQGEVEGGKPKALINWENELNINITEEDWENMCFNTWKTTNSQFWREFSWKLQIRYFITPMIQSKFNSNIAPGCWRKCGESKANYTHILYSCPVLEEYWSAVKEEMGKIFKCDLSLGLQNLLLGTLPKALSLKSDKYLYRILRITAIKQITKLKPKPPQISKWNESIKEIYNMERITHSIRNLNAVFELRWKKINE